eukprot:scaffold182714_cov17-Tisochrysis_lutea.AAC.2
MWQRSTYKTIVISGCEAQLICSSAFSSALFECNDQVHGRSTVALATRRLPVKNLYVNGLQPLRRLPIVHLTVAVIIICEVWDRFKGAAHCALHGAALCALNGCFGSYLCVVGSLQGGCPLHTPLVASHHKWRLGGDHKLGCGCGFRLAAVNGCGCCPQFITIAQKCADNVCKNMRDLST